jgi:hypothetical protein
VKNGGILTHTGKVFYPLNPDSKDIDPIDIAHALSNQCRFNGTTKKYYSVAQHSVLVSDMVEPKDRLWGLLHDAAEAYLGDLVTPIKRNSAMGVEYRAAEEILMKAVCERFSLHPIMPKSVDLADKSILLAEAEELMHPNWDAGDSPIWGGATSEHISWVAGLFEGEGTFHLNVANNRTTATISISSTDFDVVAKIKAIVGKGNIHHAKLLEGRKPSYRWQMAGKEKVVRFIEVIYPLLHSRRKKRAREVLFALNDVVPRPDPAIKPADVAIHSWPPVEAEYAFLFKLFEFGHVERDCMDYIPVERMTA